MTYEQDTQESESISLNNNFDICAGANLANWQASDYVAAVGGPLAVAGIMSAPVTLGGMPVMGPLPVIATGAATAAGFGILGVSALISDDEILALQVLEKVMDPCEVQQHYISMYPNKNVPVRPKEFREAFKNDAFRNEIVNTLRGKLDTLEGRSIDIEELGGKANFDYQIDRLGKSIQLINGAFSDNPDNDRNITDIYKSFKVLNQFNEEASKPSVMGDELYLDGSGKPLITNYRNLTVAAIEFAEDSPSVKDPFEYVRQADFSDPALLAELESELAFKIKRLDRVIDNNDSIVPDFMRIISDESSNNKLEAETQLAPLLAAQAELEMYKNQLAECEEGPERQQTITEKLQP